MNVKTLIIGHGSSILRRERGKEIDAFPGAIVRLNQYEIDGFEKYAGTRTDIYVSGGTFKRENAIKDYIIVLLYMTRFCNDYYNKFKNANKNNNLVVIGQKEITDLSIEIGNGPNGWPTTGAIAIYSFMLRGFDIHIHGFDFYEDGIGHYYNQKEKDFIPHGHEPEKERIYINKLLKEGKIKLF